MEYNICDDGYLVLANRHQLLRDLMKNYDSRLRPVKNISTPTNIVLDIAVHKIVDVTWIDEFLTWNPLDYDDAKYIKIPRSIIWIPDIVIVDMISSRQAIPDERATANVRSNGTVMTSMDMIVETHCSFSIRDLPFDEQSCSLRYNSWTYAENEIDLVPSISEPEFDRDPSGEWYIESLKTRHERTFYANTQTNFTDLFFDLKIKRRPQYYLAAFFLPSFMITTLAIVGLFSPCNDAGERHEKVSMGLTTLLTMAIILLMLTGEVPKTAYGLPLLGIYLMLETGVSTIATLVSVMIMYQHRKWVNGSTMPYWLRKLARIEHKKTTLDSPISTQSSSSCVSVQTDTWLLRRPVNGLPFDSVINEKTNDSSPTKKLDAISRAMRHHCAELQRIRVNLEERKCERTLRSEWTTATSVLDRIAMISFLVINVLITAVILIYGFEQL